MDKKERRRAEKQRRQQQLAGTWAGHYVKCFECGQSGTTTFYDILDRAGWLIGYVARCSCGNRQTFRKYRDAA